METSDNISVCFFDSGIGGLSLLYECVRKLPRVNFTYFADNFNMPYGRLSHSELIAITDGIFSEIAKLNPSAAVVACNTVTAQCIEFLRSKYPFEIIGIQPAIKPAAAIGGNCLVLATPSTVHSQSLKQLSEKYGRGHTNLVACPDLAAYVEKNINNLSKEGVEWLLPEFKADSVVLGCTHYVFVKNIIKNYYGCPVFDGIEGTAAHLCGKLGISDHRNSRGQKISFKGGDYAKNREIFNLILRQSGISSQN